MLSDMSISLPITPFAQRFRGFMPVVVDVETGGFDAYRDALLEIAAVTLKFNDHGRLEPAETLHAHVLPFAGANIDPRSLEITGIDPDHPFRGALDEHAALNLIFQGVRKALKAADCKRAVLVGHNAQFDLGFLNAAIRRSGHKRSPFHPFSCFDTVTLSALHFGQTVLAKACDAAGIGWTQADAHSAIYDTEQTARLYCQIVNRHAELCALTDDPTPWIRIAQADHGAAEAVADVAEPVDADL
jgi:ribonuclease T